MSVVYLCGMVLRHRCNLILEGSGLLGCDTMSFNEVLLNMSKKCSNFSFKGQAVQEMFLDCPSTENEGTVYIGNVQELLTSQNTLILNNTAVRTSDPAASSLPYNTSLLL